VLVEQGLNIKVPNGALKNVLLILVLTHTETQSYLILFYSHYIRFNK